ncbi:immunoglobulin-like domain-containing protein [Enterococcus caccae]|uniref:Pesticidal crystal protein Cry22Aa Ig-like domain-containing protein n=1 Tax=Enterococcus caccae ATCC BAA-1240 TaxID=1158612 RepID=R3W5G3_9ENTE|nr:immunoglobulin-like domain-containing protein [Enterococcus caccae]EOL42832.1 hypothetical protein UC7_03240 [Enterococcus caccae ATCC BAA-1240]EOT67690.1 hypothetical protein I580_00072 [Enterococcus caccae ATCC BAA-1240]OJG24738.1 hypothetical protein RU98_GL001280 [Enterococcus caccae]
MKKNTIKHTIIAGFIGILGILLFIGGYIFTDTYSRANSLNDEPKKAKVILVKNVPTGKESKKIITTAKNKQKKEQIVATNTAKDTTAPTITAPEETIEQNTQVDIYEEVTATDNKDGDVTANLLVDKPLDTSVLGTQTIHYSVTDATGNTGSADRIFHIIPKSEPIATAPQAEQPEIEPATTPIDVPQPVTTTAAVATDFSPMTITMNGQTIPYQNGGQGSGQSVIDSNPSGVASTWGGAAVQSGDDGQNTHFIGHNPGAFSTVFSLGAGSQIVVTDANGTPTTYTVRTLLQLDDYGIEVGTGTDYWDLTVGTGGGERITLQSCVNDTINVFVIAYK